MSGIYVHGYSAAEAVRLTRQANILASFIHDGIAFAPGSRILEAGCGTGAQTLELAVRHPEARITAVDCSRKSLAIAQERARSNGYGNVDLALENINSLPFPDESFDGAFICFVLEHLSDVTRALNEIKRVLKPAAKLHVFEGDHGSVLACPSDPSIDRLVAAVVEFQCRQGGDPCIGRRLCPILTSAGFQHISVYPCVAYADFRRPAWIEGFTQATFIDMMKLQRESVLSSQLLSEPDWDAGITALQRTTGAEGTFSYTFFRGTAVRG